jgi:CubicO group peptidase (beta-lactamase class C family)
MRALLLLLVMANAHATIEYRSTLEGTEKTQLRTMLKNFVQSQKMAGLVVAATRGDKVIWYDGAGKANKATNANVIAKQHLFRWASVSKVSTDVFARALEQMGVLDRDDPIDKYYDFPNKVTYLKRCFSSNGLLKLTNCGKKYGFDYPLNNIRGTCFDVKSFGKVETSKGYTTRLFDEKPASGKVVFENSSNKAVCSVGYSISVASLNLNKHPITLKQLINHTAGIQHYSYLGRKAQPPKGHITNVNVIRARRNMNKSLMEWAIPNFFPKHPLVAKPGNARLYSTFGHNFAGVVIEKASAMKYQNILEMYASKMGANSIQPDYFKTGVKGNYKRAYVHKLKNGKVVNNPYDSDNSYKLSGGGVMSTIVDLGKFCAGISKDNYILKKGFNRYTHNGAHESRSLSRLMLQNSVDNKPQCIVLMTNTNHSGIKLDEIRKKIQQKLISFGVWKKIQTN